MSAAGSGEVAGRRHEEVVMALTQTDRFRASER